MAMRTASPWWASLVFGLGLIFLFIGERLLGDIDAARVFFTGILGLVPMVGVTALRAWTTMRTTGDRRRIERALLLCHAGTLVALVLYALTTKWGIDTLGIKNVARWEGAVTVLYAVMIVVSVVPVLLIEVSLGAAMRDGFDFGGDAGGDASVDYVRVRDVSWSGLSIAFAASFLFVTCQVAKERNVSRDVSYFKTSAPGESTINIVSASTEPIKVHLFFPQTNEVKEQVMTYFEALKRATGKVEVEAHDRLAETSLATKYRVSKDGVIVIARGEGDKAKDYTIELDTDIDKMRRGGSSGAGGKLRNLDREVNSILMKVVREKRKAYLTTGHGEITSYASVPPELKGKIQERFTTIFKRRLTELNYEIKDLSLMDLAKDVPDDATLVVVLAPSVPFQPAEWDAIGRYLDNGGHVLISLDPTGAPSMGSLEGRLGLRMAPGNLTDDKSYLPQRGTLPDRRVVLTSQFSAHASTTTLSRESRNPFFLIDAGALEEIPFTVKGEAPKRTITIHSMETAWLDLNDNFTFDADKEKRQKWNIGAAVEGPKAGDKEGFRALVFSDADLFVDIRVSNGFGPSLAMMASGPLLDDAVRWLGGEEKFVGEVVSEEDKQVQHTKAQDAVWFTITVIGVPLLVLGLGLFGTLNRRKKKPTKEEEVTP